MSEFVLHYAPDNASLCIRLALESAGMPYRAVLVDRSIRAQDTAAYRALNPNGLIPVLETPDGALFETAAILLWLSEQPQGYGLMPRPGDAARGQALTWLFWLSNTLHPRLRILFYPEKYIAAAAQAALTAANRQSLVEIFDILEAEAARAPDWLRPGAASAHIAYLCPMLRWPALYPEGATDWFDLKRWPHLHQIAKVTESQPWAIAACTADGLGITPFSNPFPANPPEGSPI